MEEKFSGADSTLTPDGTCRLHPQLARRLVGLVAEADGLTHILQQVVGMLACTARRRTFGQTPRAGLPVQDSAFAIPRQKG
jgi:hypothetical protein